MSLKHHVSNDTFKKKIQDINLFVIKKIVWILDFLETLKQLIDFHNSGYKYIDYFNNECVFFVFKRTEILKRWVCEKHLSAGRPKLHSLSNQTTKLYWIAWWVKPHFWELLVKEIPQMFIESNHWHTGMPWWLFQPISAYLCGQNISKWVHRFKISFVFIHVL